MEILFAKAESLVNSAFMIGSMSKEGWGVKDAPEHIQARSEGL